MSGGARTHNLWYWWRLGSRERIEGGEQPALLIAATRACGRTLGAQSAMRFAVRFLRYRGRIVPYREVVNRPALVGELRVEECHDDELHRYLRTATLHHESVSTYRAGVPRLYDVRLMAMSALAFTLTGLERINGVEYAQSWLVTA